MIDVKKIKSQEIMNKDKIIEARNRTYDIYRRFAQKISEFDSAVLTLRD